MTDKELKAYKVHDDTDKDKWYEGVMDQLDNGNQIPEGNCPDSIYLRKNCKQIMRALSFHNHGL